MQPRIYVDGQVTAERDARVPVMDRGFLYGDGVYEVFRTAGGHGVDVEAHLDRLERSAGRIELALPPRVAVEAAIAATLRAARDAGDQPAADAYVRVVVTRGDGAFGLDPALSPTPRLVVIVRPLVLPRAESYQQGIAVRVVGVERTSPRALDPAIKSGNYLNNILALAEARRAGADEAVLCDAAGRVAEGATSNTWCVRGGEALTPPLAVGLLPGITRWRLLQLAAAAGIPCREAELRGADLRDADELFITSSIRGVLPVSRIDDRVLPVGAITRRLAALYEGFLGRVARGA
jgi:branched-chain amino acid aminotransferase